MSEEPDYNPRFDLWALISLIKETDPIFVVPEFITTELQRLGPDGEKKARYLQAINRGPFGGFRNIKDCEYAASLIFQIIYAFHGEDEARRIFSRFGPLSKARLNDIENESLLDLHDALKWTLSYPDGKWVERWSNNKLAQMLTKDGYAKQGGPNWKNLLQHIRRLRKRYGKPDRPPE